MPKALDLALDTEHDPTAAHLMGSTSCSGCLAAAVIHVADSGNDRVERRVVIEVANPPAAGLGASGE